MIPDTSIIKTWIETNIKEVHTLNDVANNFLVSSETLRKEFLRNERRTLHTFIIETRILRAQKLLKETQMRCFEICFAVGFTQEDTAAKTFKRVTGQTMEEYRKLTRLETTFYPPPFNIPFSPTEIANHFRQPDFAILFC